MDLRKTRFIAQPGYQSVYHRKNPAQKAAGARTVRSQNRPGFNILQSWRENGPLHLN
jgi:hypothetical protein